MGFGSYSSTDILLGLNLYYTIYQAIFIEYYDNKTCTSLNNDTHILFFNFALFFNLLFFHPILFSFFVIKSGTRDREIYRNTTLTISKILVLRYDNSKNFPIPWYTESSVHTEKSVHVKILHTTSVSKRNTILQYT